MRNFLFLISTLYAAVQTYVVLERQLDPPASVESVVLGADAHVNVDLDASADAKNDLATSTEEACATGCSVGSHPITPLTAEELVGFLEVFADAEGEARESALDTLLFHGGQVRDRVNDLGAELLSPDQAEFLRRELDKTHARVWMRIVDDNGVVRASVDGHRFPIGTKEHVHVDQTHDLPAPEISGTVHRTGLHHLWTRI